MESEMRTCCILFMVFGFIEIIALSITSTFDRMIYSRKNHFIGFVSFYDLWIFIYGFGIIILIGIILIIYSKRRH